MNNKDFVLLHVPELTIEVIRAGDGSAILYQAVFRHDGWSEVWSQFRATTEKEVWRLLAQTYAQKVRNGTSMLIRREASLRGVIREKEAELARVEEALKFAHGVAVGSVSVPH